MDGDVRRRVLSNPLITVEPARLDHPEGEMLAAALGDEMRGRYHDGGDDAEPAVGPAELSRPSGGTFLLARIEGRPVGCIGLRRHDDDTGEIKRMYVAPEARRSGVGRVLLGAVEAQARRLGYCTIILETGIRQPEALALYESHGYHRIPSYGHWKDSPLSVCLEKRLGIGDHEASNTTGNDVGPRKA
ncbi:MAG TPA: GNAT family N-acetyltransferase [Acidimicrobiia bacterium]